MTQNERVLAFLRDNPGASAIEVGMGCHPWVSNPRARFSDLKKAGHEIVCEPRPDGANGYRVIEPVPEPVQVALFFAEAS